MPFTDAQRKLFHAAENDPEVAERHGMSRREAGRLADEADRLARADKLAREGKEKKPKAKNFIDLSEILKPLG